MHHSIMASEPTHTIFINNDTYYIALCEITSNCAYIEPGEKTMYTYDTNIENVETIQANLEEIIEKVAQLCVKHSIKFTWYHNHIVPCINGTTMSSIGPRIEAKIKELSV